MISSAAALASSDQGLPTVSIIIPMQNEEQCIGSCLDAVLGQTYPSHLMEIIVVDGNSQDQSRQIVGEYSRRHARIRLLSNPKGTIPSGLNAGIKAAGGEVIARVDARSLLASDYLRIAIGLLATTGADNVGGPVRGITPTVTGQAVTLAWGSRFGLGGASARYGDSREQWTDTVYLGVYRRRVFETIGLYDETVPQDEDAELNYRLRSRGGRILLSPRLCSHYLNSPSMRRLAWKNLLFGYSKVLVWQKHPRMMSWRHFVPPLFVAGLFLGPFLAGIHWLFGALWIIALGSYLMACLWITACYLFQGQSKAALLLFLVFPLLHLSWGTGFIVGAIRFLPRWFRPGPEPSVKNGDCKLKIEKCKL